jgi:hypothetical protein
MKDRFTKCRINGVIYDMYTIGQLAQRLNRGPHCIRIWVYEGTMPDTPFRSAKGHRLYPRKLVDRLKRLFESVGFSKAYKWTGEFSAKFKKICEEEFNLEETKHE